MNQNLMTAPIILIHLHINVTYFDWCFSFNIFTDFIVDITFNDYLFVVIFAKQQFKNPNAIIVIILNLFVSIVRMIID